MDKDNISNTYNGNNVVCRVTAIIERLLDIQNVVQLLEVNLDSNNEDKSIIRSVQLINKMIDSMMSNELAELISLYSGCENI